MEQKIGWILPDFGL